MGKDEERAVTPFKKTIFILLRPASIVQLGCAQDYESLSPAAHSALHVRASLQDPFKFGLMLFIICYFPVFPPGFEVARSVQGAPCVPGSFLFVGCSFPYYRERRE